MPLISTPWLGHHAVPHACRRRSTYAHVKAASFGQLARLHVAVAEFSSTIPADATNRASRRHDDVETTTNIASGGVVRVLDHNPRRDHRLLHHGDGRQRHLAVVEAVGERIGA